MYVLFKNHFLLYPELCIMSTISLLEKTKNVKYLAVIKWYKHNTVQQIITQERLSTLTDLKANNFF